MGGELKRLADKILAEWYANPRPKTRPRKRQREAIEALLEGDGDEEDDGA